ncbi:7 transmembrane sweet-taste receptor of 3 GCPR-domain-containing protein [Paraphysoderma sedebokerense]|nr:7 transmembrane sweet-taste receptor of 3 GCPR-domain-containing protein [Paraphysoderma sedebokerense]
MMPGIPVGTSYTLPYYDARRLANSSDIGRGFIPGKDTFLGGMGMIMVKQSKNKHLAWSFLKRFVDTANYDYISNIGKIRQSVPPYESVQDFPPWNTQRYEIERLSLKTAVPPLYPFSGGEHGYSVIEARRSFRVLLAEMIYKNLSAEQALDRLCEVINYAFLPGCTAFNYKPMFSKCHPNGTSVVTYEWDKSKPCRDGVDLPAPTNVSCASLPVDSPQSIALFTLNGSLILYIFFAAIGFTAFRTRAIIKRSGFVFSQIIIFGSLLCAISVMVRLAEPSTASCISFPVLLGMGYILVFSSFIIKLWRVYVIFERSKVELPQALSDGVILRYLFAIVLGEALVLVLWLVIDQPGPAEYSYFAQNVGMVRFPTCAFGSVGATVVLVYNAIVLLVAAVVAWKVQNVPSDFNETKATVFAMYVFFFDISVLKH